MDVLCGKRDRTGIKGSYFVEVSIEDYFHLNLK
jgi:hypothetical protein